MKLLNKSTEKSQRNAVKSGVVGKLLLAAGLSLTSGLASAGDVNASDFTINGSKVDSLTNAQGQVEVDASVEQKFRYTGSGQTCSDVEWYIKLDGESEWDNFDHTKYAEQVIHRAGTHQLKMTVEGYNNWFTFCFHRGEYDERVVDLKISTPGYTQTNYPILIVPGVLAYDNIDLLFVNNEYFYGVADAIGDNSDQIVKNLSLNPWQDTVPRGEYLAQEILTMVANGEIPDTRVNLLAHSHGSTTSRVAIQVLNEVYGDEGRVASLTTVAGPHFGTPTADGAKIAMEEWGWTGDLLAGTLIPGFEILGDAIAFLSGNSQFMGEMDLMSVLDDFTQDGMYQFNKDYPSVALPTGAKYFLRDVVDPAVDIDEPTQAYGYGLYDAWKDGAHVNYNVEQADGSYVSQDLVIGNGLGEERDINAPDAIQYFSFGGNAPWNSTGLDPLDLALVIFNSFYGVVYNNSLGVPSAEEFIESDAFIPVTSSKFGKFIDTYYWNHVDEQNALLGLVPSQDANGNAVPSPLTVYRTHANRLQRAGL